MSQKMNDFPSKAKAKAGVKKSKVKKGKSAVAIAPPGTPRHAAGFGGLPTEIIVQACEFLQPKEALRLSFTSKYFCNTMHDNAGFKRFWRSLLYGPQVDCWGLYEANVPVEMRNQAEAHFGCS